MIPNIPDNRVYCKNCVRWYANQANYKEDINQCDIPSCGIELLENNSDEKHLYYIAIGKIDLIGIKFIEKYLDHIHFLQNRTEIFGKPSQLNQDNNCYFYLPKIVKSPEPTFWQKIINLFK